MIEAIFTRIIELAMKCSKNEKKIMRRISMLIFSLFIKTMRVLLSFM